MLKHEGVENFNWNYVDQHILGYQDFAELPEVSKISSIGIFKFKLLSSINSLRGIRSFGAVICCCRQSKCG